MGRGRCLPSVLARLDVHGAIGGVQFGQRRVECCQKVSLASSLFEVFTESYVFFTYRKSAAPPPPPSVDQSQHRFAPAQRPAFMPLASARADHSSLMNSYAPAQLSLLRRGSADSAGLIYSDLSSVNKTKLGVILNNQYQTSSSSPPSHHSHLTSLEDYEHAMQLAGYGSVLNNESQPSQPSGPELQQMSVPECSDSVSSTGSTNTVTPSANGDNGGEETNAAAVATNSDAELDDAVGAIRKFKKSSSLAKHPSVDSSLGSGSIGSNTSDASGGSSANSPNKESGGKKVRSIFAKFSRKISKSSKEETKNQFPS